MKILSANIQWNCDLTPLNIDNIQYIVIHHAEAVTASPEDIDSWHKANGWCGAGYNYYVRKDGSIYEMRGDSIGAQCYGYNSVSYGVCCEGDYEKYDTAMPDLQYSSLLEVVSWLKGRFPNAQIVGHKELYATVCPGQYFPLDDIKNLKEHGLTISEAIDILAEHSIIGDKSYWNENCIENGQVNGSYISTVIKRFVACYKILSTYDEVLDEMVSMGIIGDKSYWSENAVEKGICNGTYVTIIIIRMANYIKG